MGCARFGLIGRGFLGGGLPKAPIRCVHPFFFDCETQIGFLWQIILLQSCHFGLVTTAATRLASNVKNEASGDCPMSVGARVFVAIVFVVLGLSFIATTAALYYEFGLKSDGTDWFGIATFYSHLFLFFPIFGVLALVAFYVPASAFTDMYWYHVPMGRIRFLIGFVVLVVASYFGGQMLGQGKLRSIWEVKPDVLAVDSGEPSGCVAPGSTCDRAPILHALEDVKIKSQQRVGMAKFVRNCKPDDLVEVSPEQKARRYCFVTQDLNNARDCCAAQERFGNAVSEKFEPEDNRSLTGKVHKALLPLKIFFLLVVLAVAILLAVRRHGISSHYPNWMRKIERGVMVGAFAMLILPVMNLAFLQSSGLLYGTAFDSVYRTISLPMLIVFGAWALLLLFFFFRETDKDIETVARIAGVIGSAIAVTNHQLITDYFVRIAGSGADMWTLGCLFALGLIAFAAIVLQSKETTEERELRERSQT